MSDSWPRRRLLAILRGSGQALDAQELARVTGQHVTTVRFHLDVLTKESLVRQVQQPPRGRGRPRIGYAAIQHTVGYRDLAQVLADQLGADPKRRLAAAVTAGRAWAGNLEGSDGEINTLADAKDVVMTVMSELGFGPERDVTNDDNGEVVRFTACPLRDLARTHSEVVCGVHLGLLRELLDRNGTRGAVNASLHPFVEPELCVARLNMALQATAEPKPDMNGAGRAPGGDVIGIADYAHRDGRTMPEKVTPINSPYGHRPIVG